MTMRYRYASLVLAFALASSCGRDAGPTAPVDQPPPTSTVLLKDIVIPNLPAPFYHFEYDGGGRVVFASFASDFTRYDVTYDNGRLSEMRNNILVNHDRLEYVYDEAGRVGAVKYRDSNGVVFTVLFFTYDGQRLTGIERERKVTGGFIIDKTMSMTYYGDGNLRELTEHRPAIEALQDETTTVDRFELYDDKINVDAFSL